MTKLTDSQLLILSRAAQRDDHAVEPTPNLKGAAAQKAYRKLLDLGLLTVVPGAPGHADLAARRGWPSGRPRDHRGRPRRHRRYVRRRAAGERAFHSSARAEATAPRQDSHAATVEGGRTEKAPRVGAKLTAVLQLLQREGGATIDEIVAATGWLSHTARAALSGLRKRGYRIETERGEDRKTVYRIASPEIGGRGQHAGTAAEGEA